MVAVAWQCCLDQCHSYIFPSNICLSAASGLSQPSSLGSRGESHIPQLLVRPSTAAVSRGHDPLQAKVIELHIQSNWVGVFCANDSEPLKLVNIYTLHLPCHDMIYRNR